MIAKKLPPPNRVRVGSFRASIAYSMGEWQERPAWLHARGVIGVETAAIEMEGVAALSRCSDAVAHWVISYGKRESVTPEMTIADAERLLSDLDMADHQYVLIAHTDTDQIHAHIVANRVGPDGRAARTSHDYVAGERSVARTASGRGWDIVAGQWNRDLVECQIARQMAGGVMTGSSRRTRQRLNARERERLQQTGELPWREIARPLILDAVRQASGWDDLRLRLAAEGVVVKHSIRIGKGGRELHGLAFAEDRDGDAPGCSASEIGDNCRYRALVARFGPWPEHFPSANLTRKRGAARRSVTADERKHGTGSTQIDMFPPRGRSGHKAADDAAGHTSRVRERIEREAEQGRARSQTIDDNLRLRKEYRLYADMHRERVIQADQSAYQCAWSAEQHRRHEEIVRLHMRKRGEKALARDIAGRGKLRTEVWDAIDEDYARRIRKARVTARRRWSEQKARLGERSERIHRLCYAEWVARQAADGNESAQRQQGYLAEMMSDLYAPSASSPVCGMGASSGADEQAARKDRGSVVNPDDCGDDIVVKAANDRISDVGSGCGNESDIESRPERSHAAAVRGMGRHHRGRIRKRDSGRDL